jgi:glucan phosphoethanolaminetransferase (alkaline phosphatase superfamily)
MRRFFLLISLLLLAGTLVLRFGFHYSNSTAAYHLLLMAGAQLFVYGLATALFLLLRPKAFRIVLHALLAIDLLAIVLLYLMILGSNYFWKKTITLSVLKNYFHKFGNFINSLPVESWIAYAAFFLIIALTAGLYLLIRPRTNRLAQAWLKRKAPRWRRRFWGGAVLVLLVAAAFNRPLLRLKRRMHFAEEPVLQFALGNIWGQGNEVAFDKARYVLGNKDKACYDSLKVRPNGDDHPIIVILMDALRSDHLPAYGYGRTTTPFLDSLMRRGDLFAVRHAFSPSTNTVGGVAALFYARDWESFGYTGLNLMKYLKGAGYTTYSFLTGYHRDWFGLSALYRGSSDYYFESPKNPDIPPDDDLVTLEKFDNTPLQKRSFIYIHLLSTHTIGVKHAAFRHYLPDKIGLGTDQRTALVNNYDNGILQADYVIRRIFDRLQKAGLLGYSTVFLLADHGELFGEGGQWSHGGSVQPQLLDIPLLIWDKDRSWYRNLNTATLKDIAPTVVDRLGYPLPACWDGHSLHGPEQPLNLKVNAVAECALPYGLLQTRDSSIILQAFDQARQPKAQWQLTATGWLPR